MSERSPIGVTLGNVVIIATDELAVIAHIPEAMAPADAHRQAQRIFDEGMTNKAEHYDSFCRDDYDIETFLEEQLETLGFKVINTRNLADL